MSIEMHLKFIFGNRKPKHFHSDKLWIFVEHKPENCYAYETFRKILFTKKNVLISYYNFVNRAVDTSWRITWYNNLDKLLLLKWSRIYTEKNWDSSAWYGLYLTTFSLNAFGKNKTIWTHKFVKVNISTGTLTKKL